MTGVAIDASSILTMTLHAPGHARKPEGGLEFIHCLHHPMTLLTSKTSCHMRAVVEMNKIRNIVQADPSHLAFCIIKGAKADNLRLRRRNQCVASYATLQRWDARSGG